MRALARRLAHLLGLLPAAFLGTCSPPPDRLEQAQRLGVLRVATVNSPTTYYLDADGPAGFDYELAAGLAQSLGLRLEIVVAQTPPEALEQLERGAAHLAAGALVVTPARERRFQFTQPLMEVRPVLVVRAGSGETPRSPADLVARPGSLRVVRGSSQAERLAELRASFPALSWEETADEEAEDLLREVAEGRLDRTAVTSDLFGIHQRYYPSLRIAFDLGPPQPVAWALPQEGSERLRAAVQDHLRRLGDTELARLRDRYFGHIEPVDYQEAVALAAHAESRLPRYRAWFEKAAAEQGLDWRLLAAIGYQESHWNPAAVSVTGVRGLMQLTQATATFLGVADREDPAQAIEGAARYLRRLIDQMPPEVPEPDRTWMALAAWNMGLGHLLDARRLTEQRGGDPNRWLDVRNVLPLLSQRRWYSQTRHGYARGFEAKAFVGHVRSYYDMLVWITASPAALGEARPLETPAAPAPATPKTPPQDPLKITTPLL